MNTPVDPGWYPLPTDPSGQTIRYWNGFAWTETRSTQPAPPPPSVATHHYYHQPAVPTATAGRADGSNACAIWAMVMGGIALLVFPLFIGGGAVIWAGAAFVRKEKLAPIGMTVAVVGWLAGMLLGMIVYANGSGY